MRSQLYSVDASMRKSYLRAELLLAIVRRERARITDVADDLGLPCCRVEWMLHGKRPFYAPERSLVAVGLVREIRERGDIFLEATTDGTRAAERIHERRRETAARWLARSRSEAASR